MIGSTNLTQLCGAGLEFLESPHIRNIHPRIRGKVLGIFHRIGTTSLYPMSEIEMDKNLIFMLEHSAKTLEERELLKSASYVVNLADRNAQARNLKRAKNGEPPEEVDSEEDEEYWKCERELTAEENQYLLRNRHPNIHPRILCRANSIFARLFRKPDISLTEVKKHELCLQGLGFSCKTQEEAELVSRAAHAIWEARQYAQKRALVRARHPKGQEEDDDWEQVEFGAEFDNDAQKDSQTQAEVEPFMVDNWAAHEEDVRKQNVILDLKQKLLDSEEQLRASKEREEQTKKKMMEMERSYIKQYLIMKEQVTKESQKKEAELHGTVKNLEAQLKKSEGALRAQALSSLSEKLQLISEFEQLQAEQEKKETNQPKLFGTIRRARREFD